MKRLLIIALFSATLFITGCTPTITKEEYAPGMYAEHPRSILVLPPINKSTAADAKDFYLATVAEPLTNCGYYVYPIDVVYEILKQEGLSDAETMLNVPPQKFKQFFGTDAIMYVSILSWNTSYYVIAGNVTVSINCVVKSTTTGKVLWVYDGTLKLDTSGDSGNLPGLAGLIAKVATTAIKTAATDYVPIAQKLNGAVFSTMPFGAYHPLFDQDQKTSIVKQEHKELNNEAQTPPAAPAVK